MQVKNSGRILLNRPGNNNIVCRVAVNCGDQQSGGSIQGPADPRGTSPGLPRAAGENSQAAANGGGCVPAHKPAAAASSTQVSSIIQILLTCRV
jgi:hypothetical protein